MAKKTTTELAKKYIDRTKLKYTRSLTNSIINEEPDPIQTDIPALNIALSGKLDGGLLPGFIQITGPSKHFKSSFGIVMIKAFLSKYDDGVVLFFDNEFGSSMQYFERLGITKEMQDRIVHIPFEDIEQLKFEMVSQLEEIERDKEHVMFFVDSIGLAASKKEIEDALAEKGTADMSRAKQLASLARSITAKLKIRNVPCVVINHVYKTQEFISKDVISGGEKMLLACDLAIILSRVKEKDTDGTTAGYTFKMRLYKSRSIKEDTVVPITVTWDGGIHTWSGLSELAEEHKLIKSVRDGKKKAFIFTKKNGQELQVLDDDIDQADEFWMAVIQETNFKQIIESTYLMYKPVEAIIG